MAKTTIESCKLVVVFDAGVNAKGAMMTKSKQLGAVKPDATAEALRQTAIAYGSLTGQPLVRTERRDVVTVEA